MIIRSVAYDLTCSMRVWILAKLGRSLPTIAFLTVPCFRAQDFESIPPILRSVAYDLTCFMKVLVLLKLGLSLSARAFVMVPCFRA